LRALCWREGSKRRRLEWERENRRLEALRLEDCEFLSAPWFQLLAEPEGPATAEAAEELAAMQAAAAAEEEEYWHLERMELASHLAEEQGLPRDSRDWSQSQSAEHFRLLDLSERATRVADELGLPGRVAFWTEEDKTRHEEEIQRRTGALEPGEEHTYAMICLANYSRICRDVS